MLKSYSQRSVGLGVPPTDSCYTFNKGALQMQGIFFDVL